MNALKWIIVALALLEAGWMTFDGTRALIMGDYVTPKSGKFAGQLGPWAKLVSTVGIEPRSTLMKTIFALYGTAWLIIIGFFILQYSWAWLAMLAAVIGALWYLWIGTLIGVLQIVLLLYERFGR
jgi:hypothetical protein